MKSDREHMWRRLCEAALGVWPLSRLARNARLPRGAARRGAARALLRQSARDPRGDNSSRNSSMRRAMLALAALLCLCAGQAQEAGPDPDQDQDTDADPDTTVSVQVVEENWTIVLQPRCCSDCTFVSRGFKCKVKSCLSNCPWARSSAAPSAVPLF